MFIKWYHKSHDEKKNEIKSGGRASGEVARGSCVRKGAQEETQAETLANQDKSWKRWALVEGAAEREAQGHYKMT